MEARGKLQKGSRVRSRRQIESPGAVRDALLRLAADPKDACALIAVYDEYGDDLKTSAIRWFGKDSEVRAKATNSLLATIARQAPTYDPQSMSAAEWIHQCAETEARRLREALDGDQSKCLLTQGGM